MSTTCILCWGRGSSLGADLQPVPHSAKGKWRSPLCLAVYIRIAFFSSLVSCKYYSLISIPVLSSYLQRRNPVLLLKFREFCPETSPSSSLRSSLKDSCVEVIKNFFSISYQIIPNGICAILLFPWTTSRDKPVFCKTWVTVEEALKP